MAFDKLFFAPIGGNASKAAAIFGYVTDDTLSDVASIGYFSGASDNINPGDTITVKASDGNALLVVLPDNVTAVELPPVVVEITGDYDVSPLDDVIIFTGSPTITLLADPNKPIVIKNDGAGSGILDGNGASIEGEATVTASVARRLIKTSAGWRDIT